MLVTVHFIRQYLISNDSEKLEAWSVPVPSPAVFLSEWISSTGLNLVDFWMNTHQGMSRRRQKLQLSSRRCSFAWLRPAQCKTARHGSVLGSRAGHVCAGSGEQGPLRRGCGGSHHPRTSGFRRGRAGRLCRTRDRRASCPVSLHKASPEGSGSRQGTAYKAEERVPKARASVPPPRQPPRPAAGWHSPCSAPHRGC